MYPIFFIIMPLSCHNYRIDKQKLRDVAALALLKEARKDENLSAVSY